MSDSIIDKIDISDPLASIKNNSTKYTVYQELDNELKDKVNERTEDFLYLLIRNVDWKIILLILFISLVVFMIILNKINQYLLTFGNYDDYGKK